MSVASTKAETNTPTADEMIEGSYIRGIGPVTVEMCHNVVPWSGKESIRLKANRMPNVGNGMIRLSILRNSHLLLSAYALGSSLKLTPKVATTVISRIYL